MYFIHTLISNNNEDFFIITNSIRHTDVKKKQLQFSPKAWHFK